MKTPRTKDAGFVLLEALIATVIFTAVMGALYGGLGAGWRAWGVAGDEEAALALARSRLALAGVESPLEVGSQSGTSNGITWHSSITPYTNAPALQDVGVSGYWVRVDVSWAERGRRTKERTLSLTSLKLTRQEQVRP